MVHAAMLWLLWLGLAMRREVVVTSCVDDELFNAKAA